MYNFSCHRVDTYENLKIVFFPTKSIQEELEETGTESSINSAVR